tara:strand:- start:39 stop:680 length:642 start_codon:yes stop_codon:yes gene_type:complete
MSRRTLKNKHKGSKNRTSAISSNRRTAKSNRKHALKRTFTRNRFNKRMYRLELKFLEYKNLDNDAALERVKAIIEMEIQNNKGSISETMKALNRGFKEWKKGNVFLGWCYILLGFAILSINWGDAPKPMGTNVGGPVGIPGLRSSGTADMYYEWRHIDVDIFSLPIGYKKLERRLRRKYDSYLKKIERKNHTRKSQIKPKRYISIKTRKRRTI